MSNMSERERPDVPSSVTNVELVEIYPEKRHLLLYLQYFEQKRSPIYYYIYSILNLQCVNIQYTPL